MVDFHLKFERENRDRTVPFVSGAINRQDTDRTELKKFAHLRYRLEVTGQIGVTIGT